MAGGSDARAQSALCLTIRKSTVANVEPFLCRENRPTITENEDARYRWKDLQVERSTTISTNQRTLYEGGDLGQECSHC